MAKRLQEYNVTPDPCFQRGLDKEETFLTSGFAALNDVLQLKSVKEEVNKIQDMIRYLEGKKAANLKLSKVHKEFENNSKSAETAEEKAANTDATKINYMRKDKATYDSVPVASAIACILKLWSTKTINLISELFNATKIYRVRDGSTFLSMVYTTHFKGHHPKTIAQQPQKTLLINIKKH